MKVLIVGGGIAGLTLAGLLRRRANTRVVVLERAERFEDLGGFAIGLYPMGSRVLHGLGVHDGFVQRSCQMNGYAIHDDAGRFVRRFDWVKLGKKYGMTRIIGRDELVDVLRGGLGGSGGSEDVDLRMGVTAEAIDEMVHEVRVKMSDGREDVFDLVVGADGIHSVVRSLCFKGGEVFEPGVGKRHERNVLQNKGENNGNTPETQTGGGWGGWVWWTEVGLARETGDILEHWGRGRC